MIEEIYPFQVRIGKSKKQTVIRKRMDIHIFLKTACLVLINIFLNSAFLTINYYNFPHPVKSNYEVIIVG